MIVYGSSLSPFVRKTLAFGAEKGLALENKVAGARVARPRVPGLQSVQEDPRLQGRRLPDLRLHGDHHLSRGAASRAEPDPDRPAQPRPGDLVRGICRHHHGRRRRAVVLQPHRRPALHGRGHRRGLVRQGRERDLPPVLDYLECTIPDSGFLLEDRLTLADIAVASPFANLGHLNFDLSRWPKAKAYSEAMLARPSFAHWVAREKAVPGRLGEPFVASALTWTAARRLLAEKTGEACVDPRWRSPFRRPWAWAS
jgi:glutathione S-transferase